MSKKRIILTRECELGEQEEKENAEAIVLALAKFGIPVSIKQIPIECAGTESTVVLCGGYPSVHLFMDEENIKDVKDSPI